MISAIRLIPMSILKNIKEKLDNETSLDENSKIMVIFIQDGRLLKGKLKEIEDELSEEQKEFVRRFKYYRGIEEFQKNLNRYAFGGNKALSTCSPFHYDFTNKQTTFKNIIKFMQGKEIDNFNNIMNFINKPSEKISSLFKEYEELVKYIKQTIEIFQSFLKNKRLKKEDLEEYKIILMPEDNVLREFRLFFKKYIIIKAKKDMRVFPFDTFKGEQTQKHGILYSKFGKKPVYQLEEFNKLDEATFIKLDLFKSILDKVNLIPLPLELYSIKSNLYNKILEKGPLLKKLEFIYKNVDSKPFNYFLILSKNIVGGYSYDLVVNYEFNISNYINNEIYNLNFNKIKKNGEELRIFNDYGNHNKYELLNDMLFLFYPGTYEDGNILFKMLGDDTKQKSLKKNPFIYKLLKRNSPKIIDLVYKSNKNFLNYNLKRIINSILNESLKNKDLKEKYKNKENIIKLLLIFLKYNKRDGKRMIERLNEIEKKLQDLKKDPKKNKIEEASNDFEALFYGGLIMKHLLKKTSSSKGELELMSKYIISINTTEQLKDKIIFLTRKYAYSLKVNTNMWNSINSAFLKHDFKDKNFKSNLIPFFIGFYYDFYMKSDKEGDVNE